MSEVIRSYDKKGNILYEAVYCQDCHNRLMRSGTIFEGYMFGKKVYYTLCSRCIKKKGIEKRVKDAM